MNESSPTLGDVVRRFAAALLAARGEAVTPAQRAVLLAVGRCRTAALGGHVYRCDHCGAEHPAYNSCRSRHCPACLGHKPARAAELGLDLRALRARHQQTDSWLFMSHSERRSRSGSPASHLLPDMRSVTRTSGFEEP